MSDNPIPSDPHLNPHIINISPFSLHKKPNPSLLQRGQNHSTPSYTAHPSIAGFQLPQQASPAAHLQIATLQAPLPQTGRRQGHLRSTTSGSPPLAGLPQTSNRHPPKQPPLAPSSRPPFQPHLPKNYLNHRPLLLRPPAPLRFPTSKPRPAPPSPSPLFPLTENPLPVVATISTVVHAPRSSSIVSGHRSPTATSPPYTASPRQQRNPLAPPLPDSNVAPLHRHPPDSSHLPPTSPHSSTRDLHHRSTPLPLAGLLHQDSKATPAPPQATTVPASPSQAVGLPPFTPSATEHHPTAASSQDHHQVFGATKTGPPSPGR